MVLTSLPMTSSSQIPAPALPRRLMAMLYDTLLVIPLIGVTVAVATVIEMDVTGAANSGDYYQMHPQLVQAIAFACTTLFFTAFWSKSGQTLGMQAWRIKLVDNAGNVPSRGRCVLRCIAALLSAACLGMGYWWSLIDRRRKYWHDHLSGTELILLPKREKS
ncbi:RDD family protein [Kineobactrum sediminis]|nr:RDD family protein [Kineobactrum sediminis]